MSSFARRLIAGNGCGWICAPAQASTSGSSSGAARFAPPSTPLLLHHHHHHQQQQRRHTSSSSSGSNDRAAVVARAKAGGGAAVGSDRAELRGVAPENRAEVAALLDLADQASRGWRLLWSRFVTPPVAADALAAIGQVRPAVRLCF